MQEFTNDSLTLIHAPDGKAYSPGESFSLSDEQAKNPGFEIYLSAGKVSRVATLGQVSKKATLAAIANAKNSDDLRAIAEELETMKVKPDEEIKTAFAQAAESFRPGPPGAPSFPPGV